VGQLRRNQSGDARHCTCRLHYKIKKRIEKKTGVELLAWSIYIKICELYFLKKNWSLILCGAGAAWVRIKKADISMIWQ
jgi:hypothetical protein